MHVSKSTQSTPPFVEDYQNHMDLTKEEQKKDSKVCLLASATNPKEIQFYDNHTYRHRATDSLQKYIWETKEQISGTDKKLHKPRR